MKCPKCRSENRVEARFCNECGCKLKREEINHEERKLKRRRLIYYLQVVEKDTDNHIGFLVDITTQGIMIMSEMPLEVNKTYHLKVLLQKDVSNKEYMIFSATSKWCAKGTNSDFYDTGFELVEISDEDIKEIDNIIASLCFET